MPSCGYVILYVGWVHKLCIGSIVFAGHRSVFVMAWSEIESMGFSCGVHQARLISWGWANRVSAALEYLTTPMYFLYECSLRRVESRRVASCWVAVTYCVDRDRYIQPYMLSLLISCIKCNRLLRVGLSGSVCNVSYWHAKTIGMYMACLLHNLVWTVDQHLHHEA